jgi:hypothetical protein
MWMADPALGPATPATALRLPDFAAVALIWISMRAARLRYSRTKLTGTLCLSARWGLGLPAARVHPRASTPRDDGIRLTPCGTVWRQAIPREICKGTTIWKTKLHHQHPCAHRQVPAPQGWLSLRNPRRMRPLPLGMPVPKLTDPALISGGLQTTRRRARVWAWARILLIRRATGGFPGGSWKTNSHCRGGADRTRMAKWHRRRKPLSQRHRPAQRHHPSQ